MAGTQRSPLLLTSAFCALTLFLAGCADSPTGPLRDARDGVRASTCTLSGCTATVSPTEVVPKGDPICDISDCDLPEREDETGGGGGTGGGGLTTPADTTQQDTTLEKPCNTKDPVLDSGNIQDIMDAMWQESHPGLPMRERKEVAGWILNLGNGRYGFRLMESVRTTSCDVYLPTGLTAPSNAIAWIHTHPYTTGEALSGCAAFRMNGQTIYPTYSNEPSPEDRDLTVDIFKVPGYMLDAQQIT